MLLVIGATGHVGRAVVAELAEQGQRVRAFVRNPAKVDIRASNIEVAVGDLNDPRTLGPALDGVETAFLSSTFEPHLAELQIRFVEAAKAAGVRRIVQQSGIGADVHRCCVRAFSWFGQVEEAVIASGLQHTRLRPTFLLQNLLNDASTIATQGMVCGPYRNIPWTWVDARDVAAVAAAALTDARHAGQIYTVTGAESLTFTDLAARMSATLNKPIRYNDISSNEMRGRLQATGTPPILIAAILELWDAYVSGFLRIEPTTVVKDVTGRDPRRIEDFLFDYRDRFLRAA
jgi:uncharacterized protein YbjT (DUF2867 family)